MADTLPNIGIINNWALGTYYKTEMDTNLKAVDALVMLSVKSRSVTLPVSPTNGDRYIAGSNFSVVVRVGGAWEYYTPKVGWHCYVEDEDGYVTYRENGLWQTDQEYGFHLQISQQLRSYVIIDIADADYTLTQDEAIAGAKIIVNSGTTQRAITVPTTADGICGVSQVFSLLYSASNVEVISESGGTTAVILAGEETAELTYLYGVAAISAGQTYASKAAGKHNGYAAVATTSYTAELSSKGKIVSMNNAGASTLIIPRSAEVNWSEDCKILIRSGGAGGVTIHAATDVVLIGVTTLTTNQIVTAYYTGSDTWVIG